ncbi:hypothetical protein MMPV_001428 [Pyropia vietnamensis]
MLRSLLSRVGATPPQSTGAPSLSTVVGGGGAAGRTPIATRPPLYAASYRKEAKPPPDHGGDGSGGGGVGNGCSGGGGGGGGGATKAKASGEAAGGVAGARLWQADTRHCLSWLAAVVCLFALVNVAATLVLSAPRGAWMRGRRGGVADAGAAWREGALASLGFQLDARLGAARQGGEGDAGHRSTGEGDHEPASASGGDDARGAPAAVHGSSDEAEIEGGGASSPSGGVDGDGKAADGDNPSSAAADDGDDTTAAASEVDQNDGTVHQAVRKGADADHPAVDVHEDGDGDADADAAADASRGESADTEGGAAGKAEAAPSSPAHSAAAPSAVQPTSLRARIQSLLHTAAIAGPRPLAPGAPRHPPLPVAHIYRRGHGSAPALACRLPNVCLDAAGTLSLPPRLSGAAFSSLQVECALPLRTVVASTEPPPDLPFYDVDLVGSTVARYHMPHWWSDSAPAIEAYGVLLATNRSRLRVSCVGEGPCDEKAPPGHHLVPAVLLHDRLRDDAPTGWVKTVLGMLPPKKTAASGAVGGPVHLYAGDVFPGGAGGACFRSVTVPRRQYGGGGDAVATAAHREHVLFSMNGLARVFPPQPPACTLNVTIINRPIGTGRAAFNRRHIKNAVDVSRRFVAAASTTTLPPGVSSLSVNPRVVMFTDMSVAEQVATMQSSHLVVSLHGAEMTNALFLRRGAVIAEVMPAFYEADIFPRQANSYGVTILQVPAKPDGASHTACISHFNPPGGAHARAAAAVLSTFKQYTANAALPAARLQHLQGMNKGPLSGVPHMRMCLREQVLEVDAVRLARMVLAEGVALCRGSDEAVAAKEAAWAKETRGERA